MKKVFIALMAVGVLASCSKDDVVDVNKETIAFGDTFIENSTRAIDPSYSNGGKKLTSFQVWGSVQDVTDKTKYVPIFAGDEVTGTVGTDGAGNPNIWNCAKTQYWIKGAIYNFAAVVGGTVATLGTDQLPATISYTADGDNDLLYAKSAENIVGKLTDNDLVAFTFDHLLSKVKFTVVNKSTTGVEGTTTGYSYKVSNLTIEDLAASGTVAVPKPADANYDWSDVTGSKDVVFGNAVPVESDEETISDGESAVSNYERLVIPKAYTDLIVSFKLNTYYNNTPIFENETITKKATVTFVPGCSYNFVIELSVGEPIQFSVTTDPTWTSGDDENVTVQ